MMKRFGLAGASQLLSGERVMFLTDLTRKSALLKGSNETFLECLPSISRMLSNGPASIGIVSEHFLNPSNPFSDRESSSQFLLNKSKELRALLEMDINIYNVDNSSDEILSNIREDYGSVFIYDFNPNYARSEVQDNNAKSIFDRFSRMFIDDNIHLANKISSLPIERSKIHYVAGSLMESELNILESAEQITKNKLSLLFGGEVTSEKLQILKKFAKKGNNVFLTPSFENSAKISDDAEIQNIFSTLNSQKSNVFTLTLDNKLVSNSINKSDLCIAFDIISDPVGESLVQTTNKLSQSPFLFIAESSQEFNNKTINNGMISKSVEFVSSVLLGLPCARFDRLSLTKDMNPENKVNFDAFSKDSSIDEADFSSFFR